MSAATANYFNRLPPDLQRNIITSKFNDPPICTLDKPGSDSFVIQSKKSIPKINEEIKFALQQIIQLRSELKILSQNILEIESGAKVSITDYQIRQIYARYSKLPLLIKEYTKYHQQLLKCLVKLSSNPETIPSDNAPSFGGKRRHKRSTKRLRSARKRTRHAKL